MFEDFPFRGRALLSMALLFGLGTAFMAAELRAQPAGPPERPFVNLSDTMRARSTYIFHFSDDVPASRIPAHARAATAAVGGELRHTYTTVVRGFAASMSSAALVRLLQREDDIVSYERDSIVTIVAKPNCAVNPSHPKCKDQGGGEDPPPPPSSDLTCMARAEGLDPGYSDNVPWGIDRVGATAEHGNDNCGQGVHVYVLDTGIDLDHPDLTPVGASVDCTRGPSCVKGGDGDDDNGHGTHVAGTIAARINDAQVVGVAPAAELHAVKVLRSSGSGFLSDIIAGVQWVANQVGTAPVVANLSLGADGSKSGSCSASGYSGSSSFYEAICDATNLGVVFVVAAGNDGEDAASHIPAAYHDTAITVSATREGDTWTYWSNWGDGAPAGWTGETSAPVLIGAPGGWIESTVPGGGLDIYTGTSMATPHVAGAAALHLQQFLDDAGNSSLPADFSAFTNVRDALLGSAEDASAFSREVDPDDDSVDPHEEDFLDVDALVPAPPS